MKIAAIVALSIVVIFLGIQIVSFISQESQLNGNLADIASRLTKAQSDEADFQQEEQYLANPVNLEKELRARFNYKKPGETMIVIVPPQISTSTTSTD